MANKLKHEQRLSVKDGDRRSTIWKVVINKSDIYITSRITKNMVKLSLHESGDCNYSFTTECVNKNNTLKKENRHIQQWRVNPTGKKVEILFELFIPHSELVIHPYEKKISKVSWIDPPKEKEQIQLVGYLTPKLAIGQDFQIPKNLGNVLINIQLENLKYFVLTYKCIEVTKEDILQLEKYKSLIAEKFESESHVLMSSNKESTAAFIEVHNI